MPTNLSKASGSVNLSGTSTDTITVGFQPKVVILCTGTAFGVPRNRAQFSLGFSDGTNHRYVAWSGDDAASTSNVCKATSVTKAAAIFLDDTPTINSEATVAMTSTGFTLTWSPSPLQVGMSYIALGGSDLANVAIGTNTMPTSTGNKATTGLGFTPNFVMLLSGSMTAAGTAVNTQMSYGCAISTSKRFAHALAVQDGQTMSANVNGVSDHRNDGCLLGLTTGAALNYIADFVSFDAGAGFTINFSTAPASAFQFFYCALGGANLNWDMGTAARPTTATTQSVTSTSFTPEIAIWSNSDLTTLNSITSDASLCLGSATTTSDGQFVYTEHNDAINTVCNNDNNLAGADNHVQEVGLLGTASNADFTSFQSNGWTITWNSTGSAVQISWIALAGTTSGGQTVGEMVASTQFGQMQPVIEKLEIIPY